MDRTDPLTGTLPLSVGQEGLWLLHTLHPESTTYNLAGGGRITPAPDLAALDRAWRALLTRHPMLRSRFTEVAGRPRRVVDTPEEAARIAVVEVPDATEEELRRRVNAEVRRPFRLRDEGAVRATLLLRRTDALLVVVTHHIATDAISQWLLWRDLFSAYEAEVEGHDPDWRPIAHDYDEFVGRERTLLDSPRGTGQGEFWRAECEGSTPAELPTDRPRPAASSHTGASLVRRLPDALAHAVSKAAAERHVSPFALMVGAFQAMLHRCTGQSDFLIACPASTRRAAAADIIGYFVNPVLIRARFDRETTLGDAVEAAADRVRQATARVSYPFPLVAQGSSGPLFRISVTMVATDRFGRGMDGLVAGEQVTLAGHQLAYVEIPHLEGQCDLALEITRDAHGLTVALRYDTDLFEEATAQRLFDQFQRCVTATVEAPDTRVARVPLTDDTERNLLLALSGGQA
ncbi:condensation domain-containing protein [Streptomyces spectabilis]|uniref:Condensation domain-containing protein n=1 Tax=Streptomyces spectabilis TaxID=68270 RepID=A0A516R3K1_STRST|nr:condensation domain-containing protein [Streptomyces spectabilis]QDQ10237.1 hypothetical protein FH965_06420 [Streptomyces spectabilis]